ncbi:3-oxoacyl-[acyl-carrier-protein] synthase III C-terminal domain-containing protein [Spirillospora sp. NPDC048911]|uniref:3-oxoacyl-[acyl-carrier-protein] synthase III C-terminal domain-containing protein n=1 Tax=Spirillospora sp. NPDC048911 TaxID=3364527 RepID=UPI003715402B
MATTIEAAAFVPGRRHTWRGQRELADTAIKRSVSQAGLVPGDVDLLINTGLYHERNLGEPAMAALIQQDVGANPEDPHAGGHGTFSFDVANGTCGPLTALQIADGFLRAGTIKHAVIVAGDARPDRRPRSRFPFRAGGAAAVCRWAADGTGVAGFHWENAPEGDDLFRADVVFERGRNALRIEHDPRFGDQAAALAAKAASALLAELDTGIGTIDLVVPSPLAPPFLYALPAYLGIAPERLVNPPGGSGHHTASLLIALAAAEATGRLRDAHRVLLVCASAGITAGAALLVR